jgi:hypothetical protein
MKLLIVRNKGQSLSTKRTRNPEEFDILEDKEYAVKFSLGMRNLWPVFDELLVVIIVQLNLT